jgi:capsular polysaccharide biosynthesis protein
VLVAGLIGLVLCGLPARLSDPGYTSSVSLFVGAAVVDGPEDPAYATLVPDEVLPSVAALGNSTTVLARVVAGLHLSVPPAVLARDVEVTVTRDTGVVTLAVTADARARAGVLAATVGAEVRQEAVQLFSGSGRSPVSVTVLGAPTPAVSAAQAGPTTFAAVGLAGGMALAALAAGLAELRRPRVRSRRDVAGVTRLPALPLPARSRAVLRRALGAIGIDDRDEELVRLRWLLGSWLGEDARHRVAVTGPAPDRTVAVLAAELRTAGLEAVPVADPGQVSGAGPVDGVLVVADARRSTTRQLRQVLDALTLAGAPVLGVVVDGLLPTGAGWRARLRAGLRGDGVWSRERRGQDAPPAGDERPSWATRAVATLSLVALGFTLPLPFALSTGLLVTVALLPVWAPVVRRHRGAPLLFVLAGLGLASGVLLTWLSSGDHDFAQHEAIRVATLVLTSVFGIGLILWARTVLPAPVIGIAFGAGNLIAGLGALGVDNPWKFVLSFPVIVIVLSVVAMRPTPLRTVAALAVLGLVDVVNDYRSAFGFSVLAAALVLWQARRAEGAPRIRWWIAVPGFAALAALGYSVMTQLLLSGALGAEIQQRSATQIAQSGSLLLGGRPEWTATWALMQDHPLGFGLGTVPTAHDTVVAKAGLAVTHIPGVDGYLEHQLLSGAFQLHSIIADMWAVMGPVGVLLGLAMAALGVHSLVTAVGRRTASGLVCCLVPMGLWDLAFGPLQDNLPTLTLALGLLLVVRERRPGTRRPDPGDAAAPDADRVPAAVAG